jgi:hypothetical protein
MTNTDKLDGNYRDHNDDSVGRLESHAVPCTEKLMDAREKMNDIISGILWQDVELAVDLECSLESTVEPLIVKPETLLWLEKINDRLDAVEELQEALSAPSLKDITEERKDQLSAIICRIGDPVMASHMTDLVGQLIGSPLVNRAQQESPSNWMDGRNWDEIYGVYRKMCLDEEFCQMLNFGQPREGHAEGTIQAHIDEISSNLMEVVKFLCSKNKAKPGISRSNLEVLKILILSHDSLKSEAQPGVGINDPRSHASLAREYVAKHTSDKDILEMIQRHDEPYAIYKKFKETGKIPTERLQKLVNSIGDWDTFLIFQTIDNATPSKLSKADAEHVCWFVEVSSEFKKPKMDHIGIYNHLRSQLAKTPQDKPL